MQILKIYPNFSDFVQANQDRLYEEFFIHYHLIKILQSKPFPDMEIYEAYNILRGLEVVATCVWVTGNYFIYSQKWDEETLAILNEHVYLRRFKDFAFIGAKAILVSLFNLQDVPYSLDKDRIVYECSTVDTNYVTMEGIVRQASNLIKLDELTQISMSFYQEEYQGKGLKTFDEMRGGVAQGILSGRFFYIESSGQIACITQVVSDTEELPMIGNLYTKPPFRNKGFASKLVMEVTQMLLEQGYQKCGLISDATNPISNHIFQKLGFRQVYDWVSIFKEGRSGK